MKPEQERLRTVLKDTVTLLCKSGLSYGRDLKVQGLLGITIDDEEVFIVHLNESYSSNDARSGTASSSTSKSSLSGPPLKSPSAGVPPRSSASGTVSHTSSSSVRPPDNKFATQSAANKGRGGMTGGVSSMPEAAKQATDVKAKQKLPFSAGVGRARGGTLSQRGGTLSQRGGTGTAQRGNRGGVSSHVGRGGPARGGMSQRGGLSNVRPPAASPHRPIPSQSGFSRGGSNSTVPPHSAPSGENSSQNRQPVGPKPKMMGQGFQKQRHTSSAASQQGQGFSPNSEEYQYADASPPPMKRFKTEVLDDSDDVQAVDESGATESDLFGVLGRGDDGAEEPIAPGMIQQTQITRVTITTNEQGQPVHQYERVQSATGPALALSSGAHSAMNNETSNFTEEDFLSDITGQAGGSFAHDFGAAAGANYEVVDGEYDTNQSFEVDESQSNNSYQYADYESGMPSSHGMNYADEYMDSEDWSESAPAMKQAPVRGRMSAKSGYVKVKPEYPGEASGSGVRGVSNMNSARGRSSRGARGQSMGRGESGRSRGAGRASGRGSRGAGMHQPNNEAFCDMKGHDSVGEGGDGTWKMVSRFLCSVPGCEQSFSNKSNLIRHQNQKHGREAPGRGGGIGGGTGIGGEEEEEEYDDEYEDM